MILLKNDTDLFTILALERIQQDLVDTQMKGVVLRRANV